MTETPDMLATALTWQAAGFSVVRVATDGTKAPLGSWKRYQTKPPDADQVRAWFTNQHPGLGLVMGAVSGHAEMLEIEGRAIDDGTANRLANAMNDHGADALWQRLLGGYVELTPSGGLHLIYRVDGGVAGNTKLARRPTTSGIGLDVLVETRGEGGFVIIAPSHGPIHPTGNAWVALTHAKPGQVLTLTADERDTLHAIASLLDDTPAEPEPEQPTFDKPSSVGLSNAGLAPGEDFNTRGDWEQLLAPHGWQVARRLADRTFWTRPGKDRGISAVTGGQRGDYFWCWSTSTELPDERAMSKWRVYALLEHGGDFTAAAKALRSADYGQPPTRSAPQPTVVNSHAVVSEPVDRSTTLTYSDDANALTLIDIYGDTIRYCPERGRWLSWTGQRWTWCPPNDGAVREHAKAIARRLPDNTPAAVRHKTRALSAVGVTAMLTQAETDPRIVVHHDQLDANPYQLNTPNGILDLRANIIGPPDPTAFHTRITTANPNPDADPQPWLSFLRETFNDDDDLIGYVQRLVGYSATGIVHDHILPFCHGEGGNGKTVFLETVQTVLGDYATTAPNGFLMATLHAKHETEIARLAGARMVLCSEVNQDDRFDEAKVKQLTGGDTLTARFMRADHFSFKPTHHLWLMGNHKPNVRSGGYAFWRRLRLIPFTRTVPNDKRIEGLAELLAGKHGDAILAWIAAGAVNYFATGLRTPNAVVTATGAYAHDQDTVARFLETRCHLGGGDQVRIKVTTLRTAYEQWCVSEGEAPLTAKALGLALRKHGVGSARHGQARFYTGITLLLDDEDAPCSNELVVSEWYR